MIASALVQSQLPPQVSPMSIARNSIGISKSPGSGLRSSELKMLTNGQKLPVTSVKSARTVALPTGVCSETSHTTLMSKTLESPETIVIVVSPVQIVVLVVDVDPHEALAERKVHQDFEDRAIARVVTRDLKITCERTLVIDGNPIGRICGARVSTVAGDLIVRRVERVADVATVDRQIDVRVARRAFTVALTGTGR